MRLTTKMAATGLLPLAIIPGSALALPASGVMLAMTEFAASNAGADAAAPTSAKKTHNASPSKRHCSDCKDCKDCADCSDCADCDKSAKAETPTREEEAGICNPAAHGNSTHA